MTYAEILSTFNLKLDKEINAYFSNSEIATMLNEALYRLLDDRYRAFEASNRISEHISPLVVTVACDVAQGATFFPNNADTLFPIVPINVDNEYTYTGWLYPLDVRLQLTQMAITYSATAVETTSSTVKNHRTIQLRKLNHHNDELNDPYLEGSFAQGAGAEKFENIKVFYKLISDGIQLVTRDRFSNASSDYEGFLTANDEDSFSLTITCIRKPTEFTSALLEGTATYKELSPAGQRDLIDYAIQVSSEITREKEEYQYISSQIQKDLM